MNIGYLLCMLIKSDKSLEKQSSETVLNMIFLPFIIIIEKQISLTLFKYGHCALNSLLTRYSNYMSTFHICL